MSGWLPWSRTPKRLADEMLAQKKCTEIKPEVKQEKSDTKSSSEPQAASSLRIFKLAQEEKKSPGKMLRRFEVGKPVKSKAPQNKVLMVVGATGAGKSTLINGMINYILGVEWEDNFRFKLIVDQVKTQTDSVTSDITAYTIHQMNGARIEYTLTLIDTPGFGDTKGLERDREITKQIKDFFSLTDGNGIDHLDAIGFVAQSSLVRLTPTQQYIFDSILSIFGSNVKNNIFVMVTFCDNQKPPVVDAIKAGNVPCNTFFKFNNAALFSKGKASSDQDSKGEDDESDEEDEFGEIFWRMGMKSFEKFFKKMQGAESVSLFLTRQVLENREKLEAAVQGLQRQMEVCLGEMEVLRQEKKVLEEFEAQIAANKEFIYEIKVPSYKTIKLPTGHYVTNCLTCNFTCHYPCKIPDDGKKWRCAAMASHHKENAHCRQCPNKCSWKAHKNTGERFELEYKTETRHYEDLKKKYDDATNKKIDKSKLISGHARELEKAYTQLHKLVEETRQCLNILNDIALKPNPLTQVDYIELLIESEKSQGKPGWQERVQCLTKAIGQAKWMTQLADGDNSSVPSDELDKLKRIKEEVEEHKQGPVAEFVERMTEGVKQIGQGITTGVKTMFGFGSSK